MARFCTACATQVADETARFCAKCGAAVAAPQTLSPSSTPSRVSETGTNAANGKHPSANDPKPLVVGTLARRGLAAPRKVKRAVLVATSVLLLALVGYAARDPVYRVFHKPDANGMYPDGTLARGYSGFEAHLTDGGKPVAEATVGLVTGNDNDPEPQCVSGADGECDIFTKPKQGYTVFVNLKSEKDDVDNGDTQIDVDLQSGLWTIENIDLGKLREAYNTGHSYQNHIEATGVADSDIAKQVRRAGHARLRARLGRLLQDARRWTQF